MLKPWGVSATQYFYGQNTLFEGTKIAGICPAVSYRMINGLAPQNYNKKLKQQKITATFSLKKAQKKARQALRICRAWSRINRHSGVILLSNKN